MLSTSMQTANLDLVTLISKQPEHHSTPPPHQPPQTLPLSPSQISPHPLPQGHPISAPHLSFKSPFQRDIARKPSDSNQNLLHVIILRWGSKGEGGWDVGLMSVGEVGMEGG